MIKADMDLEKALDKVAQDAAALNTEGAIAAQALENIMLAIKSGQGRGLREVGIFVNLNKQTERAQQLAELPARNSTRTRNRQQKTQTVPAVLRISGWRSYYGFSAQREQSGAGLVPCSSDRD